MSVDEQQQPDEICPNCRKAIRKRSKGSFTAWIFQDAICSCVPGAASIADVVVAASTESTAQSRKRSLMGESAPVAPQTLSPAHQMQPAPQSTQPAQPAPGQASVGYVPAGMQTEAGYTPQQLAAGYVSTPPTPHPVHTSLSQAPSSLTHSTPQQHTSFGDSSPHVVAPSKPSFITIRDLTIASITAVVLYLSLKLTGNEMVILCLAGATVVLTLVAVGVRFVRK